ncbi:MAG: hypothetical protein IPJ20_23190 [Flammeovirgaceae bacterium]|nr:hypothetical protein [Flammeovirgaceae bacterium]
MDISMPRVSGIVAVKMMDTQFSETPVLIQTVLRMKRKFLLLCVQSASGYILIVRAENYLMLYKRLLEGGAAFTPHLQKNLRW